MRSAMNTITSVAQSTAQKREPKKGRLILDLKSFDVRISFIIASTSLTVNSSSYITVFLSDFVFLILKTKG